MATVFVEQFGSGQGVILGIQGKQEGADSISFDIVDVHLNQTNLSSNRAGFVEMLVNTILLTQSLKLNFELTDETYDQRTLQGYPKKRNPEAVTK